MCAVATQRGCRQRRAEGESGGGGSTVTTSVYLVGERVGGAATVQVTRGARPPPPAPPPYNRCIAPSSRAASTAVSSTIGPRAVLIRIASRFMDAKNAGSTSPSVSGASGQCNETASAHASASCRGSLWRDRFLIRRRKRQPRPRVSRADVKTRAPWHGFHRFQSA